MFFWIIKPPINANSNLMPDVGNSGWKVIEASGIKFQFAFVSGFYYPKNSACTWMNSHYKAQGTMSDSSLFCFTTTRVSGITGHKN